MTSQDEGPAKIIRQVKLDFTRSTVILEYRYAITSSFKIGQQYFIETKT